MSTTIKPSGRPCLLTPDLQAKICQYIAAGNYLSTACAAVGISPDSYHNWIERGQAEIDAGDTAGQFFGFIHAIKRAEADREAIIVGRLVEAAMPGVRKKVTKPVTVKGIPQFDSEGNIRMTTETTETGGEWLAAATFLQRRHPDRWGIQERTVQGGNTYNINIDKAIIDAAGKFDAIMSRLAERTAAPLAIPAATDAADQDTDKDKDSTA